MHGNQISSYLRVFVVAAIVLLGTGIAYAAGPSAVADAAMRQANDTVRTLLKDGADVNAAQGDGMTALHWAALHGDGDLAKMLLYAGANVRATTRLGGYTPLHLASEAGVVGPMQALLDAGAPIELLTATGVTPLMLAATSGNVDAVALLVDRGAKLEAKDSAHGETALMFAAALDRVDVVKLLVKRGADLHAKARVFDFAPLTPPGDEETMAQAEKERAKAGTGEPRDAAAPAAKESGEQAPAKKGEKTAEQIAGVTRPFTYSELVGKEGGLTALHFAARQGNFETARVLVESGADVNERSSADGTTPTLIAAVNGQFDIAKYFLDHGADPNVASSAGATPLFAVINTEWAPKSFYPQPRAQYQQKLSYLELMRALLDKGADPNIRIKRPLWYTQYNFDLLRVDETGATPFWRAAYASDIDAMRLLVKYGADPAIPTAKPAENNRFRQGGTRSGDESKDHSGLPPVPVGGPGIPPLLAAAGAGYGEGFAANAHRFAPTGMLAAVKYLIEELHADVTARDADGLTALHNAASRGDNEMILYLVSKGADVTAVNRIGQTTVDMANGPVQRTQPYPETIALLEKLGAKNNHKCVSCD
jgi:uncharacterized protein